MVLGLFVDPGKINILISLIVEVVVSLQIGKCPRISIVNELILCIVILNENYFMPHFDSKIVFALRHEMS